MLKEVIADIAKRDYERKVVDLQSQKLEQLCAAWKEIKDAERAATARRHEIEAAMVDLLDVPEEGTATAIAGEYKATATARLTRKLDTDMWEDIKDEIPTHLWPIRTKLEIDTKKLRIIEESSRDMYRLVSRAINSKPAKVGMKVVINEDV